ncbi:MAG: hypothetical protein IPG52_12985 [Rhodocyclaceae bacterium]|nr:hypothetical protein [Rhodocyclaceae bacterium]
MGGFDEDFFCYFEDVDLGFRLRLRGYRAMHARRGGSSSGRRHHGADESDCGVYHGQRHPGLGVRQEHAGHSSVALLDPASMLNLASLAVHALRGQGMGCLEGEMGGAGGARGG